MLTSLALIFLLGLMLGSLFTRLKLPPLLGMLITGIILSPYALNLLDDSILSISTDLRQLALVIILTRAGLALDVSELKKVGRPAILMCFVPALFEIAGVMLLAPLLLGVTVLEAAIMGSVIAAVSPAVVVPRMLRLIQSGYGTDKDIPQLIMAGASVDDVFVIVLFTSFTGLAKGGAFSPITFVQIPVSIVTGLVVGIGAGLCLSVLFRRLHIRDSAKVIILLSVSFLLMELEKLLGTVLPISGLLAVMSMSATIFKTHAALAARLSAKFSKLWVGAEILLFVLVGATVNLRYAWAAGAMAVLVIAGALLFRMAGVWCCLLKTVLTVKERIFCMLAYMPKATVQAAIGAIPLSMGLPCGQLVMTVAVLSILITAPLGAVSVDKSYRSLLQHSKNA
ncbi:sodium/proton antiporter (CPA1 family) [Hydrogenoanaerobacterium saccharovorans]|uniref:Sodium/proton antiporter, CPA1 family n=1 Tax=Hydrogenoanaerobacterium saccharovorans TaxID=474960 RepID=A0A1H8AA56_9FIRM|nr:cation:proton antiporter [Hydrogenoanaerobacterium saccharovorans]RPF48106.1 sodium/proton antiporter (CPA1 family) [Hydrogenoanaerobacterium saccharovorans]SEM66679.1 sodium/proton antiporter, CPA1 family [Hydrogenoanaerobacterium saccharovorans]